MMITLSVLIPNCNGAGALNPPKGGKIWTGGF